MRTPAELRLAIAGLRMAVALHERDGEPVESLAKAAMLMTAQWCDGKPCQYIDDVVEALSLREAFANN